jgi:hypothetical protein
MQQAHQRQAVQRVVQEHHHQYQARLSPMLAAAVAVVKVRQHQAGQVAQVGAAQVAQIL